MSVPSSEAREIFAARMALIMVATAVAYPSALSTYIAASRRPDPSHVVAVSGLWLGFAILSRKPLNVRFEWLMRRSDIIPLVLDVVGLTALLSLSGAAQNPFSMLYFVPITLTTIVAPSRTWQVALLSVVGFFALLVQTMAALAPHRQHAAHAHFLNHVTGMAWALAIVGAFVTYFIHRVARRLDDQRKHMAYLERQQAEDRFAVALGALSAGAAHELGTPLGTVQLLAEELPYLDSTGRDAALLTITSEVQRMKKILHGLSAGELSAEVLNDCATWQLQQLSLEPLPPSVKFENRASGESSLPRAVLVQMIRELVRNALKVTGPKGVSIIATSTTDQLRISVLDDGPGMPSSEASRLFRPFVSETGGTGLGLFLTSVHARQLGGSLELQDRPGPGTTMVLTLPLRLPCSLVSP